MAEIVEGKHGVLRFSWQVHGHDTWDTATHSAQGWWCPLGSSGLISGVSPLTFVMGAQQAKVTLDTKGVCNFRAGFVFMSELSQGWANNCSVFL